MRSASRNHDGQGHPLARLQQQQVSSGQPSGRAPSKPQSAEDSWAEAQPSAYGNIMGTDTEEKPVRQVSRHDDQGVVMIAGQGGPGNETPTGGQGDRDARLAQWMALSSTQGTSRGQQFRSPSNMMRRDPTPMGSPSSTPAPVEVEPRQPSIPDPLGRSAVSSLGQSSLGGAPPMRGTPLGSANGTGSPGPVSKSPMPGMPPNLQRQPLYRSGVGPSAQPGTPGVRPKMPASGRSGAVSPTGSMGHGAASPTASMQMQASGGPGPGSRQVPQRISGVSPTPRRAAPSAAGAGYPRR